MKVFLALSLVAPAWAHIIRKEIGAGARVVLAGRGGSSKPSAVSEALNDYWDVDLLPSDHAREQASASASSAKGREARPVEPYPKLQDRETFHDDFVKDDNSDGGKWSAQVAYDKARRKVSRENREAEDAERRVLDAKSGVEAARKQVAASHRKEKEAEEEARMALKKAAAKREEKATEKTRRDTTQAGARQEEGTAEARRKETEKKVQDAKHALEQQEAAFKTCERELEAARAEVQELEKQKPNLVDQGRSSNKAAGPGAEEDKALQEARARTAQAEAKRGDAVERLIAARSSKEQAQEQLRHEEEERAKAQQQTQKQAQEVEEAERDLSEAKANLRQARGQDAVPGDPPPPAKAAAHGGSPTALVLTAPLVASLLGWGL